MCGTIMPDGNTRGVGLKLENDPERMKSETILPQYTDQIRVVGNELRFTAN